MTYLTDSVLDSGLSYVVTNAGRVDICSTEPTTYTQATSTYTLGNATVTPAAIANGAVDGRQVTIPAITSGTVTGTGTAAFWALTDGLGILIATRAMTSQAVTTGNTFTTTSNYIAIRDATAI